MSPQIIKYLNQLLAIEENLFIVGGVLRDRYLGLPYTDFDFSLKNASKLAAYFAKQIRATLVDLDDTPGRETYRVIDSKGNTFDFSEINGESITNDLTYRDFTFNAMAQRLKDFLRGMEKIIDPYNGIKDLKQKKIRSLPGPVLENDPLRVLRAFRFAAILDFEIDSLFKN